jgi:hypothetical protein
MAVGLPKNPKLEGDPKDQPLNVKISLKILRRRKNKIFMDFSVYTGCPGRNVKNFGRVFLMLKYTDITQNTYIQI